MKALNFVIFTLIFVVKVEGDEEWNGGRPPPFFPQGKERPIPRYAPTFSRYTPFLTEETLPKPVYGRQMPESPREASIYKAQGRPLPREGPNDERNAGNPAFPFRTPPYFPGSFPRMTFEKPPPRREYPEPFRGPRGETEESREEPPPFLPPQFRGQRIPPPEYFERKEPGDRPFFGSIQPHSNPKLEATTRVTPRPLSKPPHSNYSSPEYGSEVQIDKDKSRPGRLFAVKPPEFPPIPTPPPYPSPAPFTPHTPPQKPQPSEATTQSSPSIYSPLQGPFPEENSPTPAGPTAPGKKKPNGLPPSFRSFFPPGFGPFADKQNRKL